MPSPTLIRQQSNILSGPLWFGDGFDLSLVKRSTGDYELVVFMKLQFFFENQGNQRWTATEKTQFVNNWEKAIKGAWGGRVLKNLSGGKKVFVGFDFKTQIGGWMFDHWEITVTKIKPGTFSTSYVTPAWGNVTLDSEDLNPVNKGAASPQRGAVHEFGHMLGLADEYKKSSPHSGDTMSVMHSAETIRPRHNSTIMKWLNSTLALKNIK